MGRRVAERRGEDRRQGEDRLAFAEALALLAEYFRTPEDFLDVRRMRVYEHGLRDVPGLLVKAAALYATEHRVFFPRVVELKADAEYCRQRLVAEHPWDPCAACAESTTPGWTPMAVDGVLRLQRCACWEQWRAVLTEMGAPASPLRLPMPERGREEE